MNFRVIDEQRLAFSGEDRTYDVVDRNLGVGEPRYFISYNNGRPFISDEVPEAFRAPMVFHELMEFESLKGQPDSCLNSLKAELETFPELERA